MNNLTRITIGHILTIPSIFKWFKPDFDRFLNGFNPNEIVKTIKIGQNQVKTI